MIDAKLSCGQISHLVTDCRVSMSNQGEFRSSLSNLLLLTMVMMTTMTMMVMMVTMMMNKMMSSQTTVHWRLSGKFRKSARHNFPDKTPLPRLLVMMTMMLTMVMMTMVLVIGYGDGNYDKSHPVVR